MATEIEFLDAYKRIKSADECITIYLDAAITYEEHENPLEAIEAYKQALIHINEAFTIPVGLPDDADAIETQWADACAIIQKLKASKEAITQRLKILRQQNEQLIDQEASEAMEDDEGGVATAPAGAGATTVSTEQRSVLLENPRVRSDVVDAMKLYKQHVLLLRELLGTYGTEQENLTPDGHVQFDRIFQAPVKLYRISTNGVVETLTGESVMTLIMCSVQGADSKWRLLNGTTFIRCSLPETPPTTPSTSSASTHDVNWIYPLLPTVTNCYRTDYDAFIFPDLATVPTATAATAGNAFGIMLSNDVNQIDEEAFEDLKQFFLDLLEAILAEKVAQLAEGQEETRWRTEGPETTEKISRGIVNGADFIARTLIRGAEKTGELLDRGTPYVMSKMQSAPANARPVSTTVQRTVGAAKAVTGAAAGATGWVAGKIGAAAQCVGAYLAPHVEAQGAKVLECGFGYQKNEAESKMKGAMTIAAGAVEGFTTVYSGLEQSADVLGKSLSNNSVKIISHKYGTSAGGVAADTFETIGYTWHVSKNLKIIKPKGFAESMLKTTGKSVVGDYKDTLRGKKRVIAAGELQPELRNPKKKS